MSKSNILAFRLLFAISSRKPSHRFERECAEHPAASPA
jgi:hypothetical protein